MGIFSRSRKALSKAMKRFFGKIIAYHNGAVPQCRSSGQRDLCNGLRRRGLRLCKQEHLSSSGAQQSYASIWRRSL